jgi:hypothetical protein
MPKNETALPSNGGTKLPTTNVARRYGVVPRSIERWQKDPKLEFPQPLIINGRKYWSLAELETWEREQATRRT